MDVLVRARAGAAVSPVGQASPASPVGSGNPVGPVVPVNPADNNSGFSPLLTPLPPVAPFSGLPVGSTPSTANRPRAERRRDVDVAQFHNLPLAGTPIVRPSEDATLTNMDPMSKLLAKLETKGTVLAKGIGAYRLSTEAIGPASWGLSAILNVRLFMRTLKDPTIATPSKVALGVATAANAVGALFAVASSRFVGPFLHLATAGRIVSNKLAGIVGGVGGNIFNVINLIETLRNKDATPSQRFFAKVGFVLGMAGFLFGTAAMLSSMPAVATLFTRLPWFLPLATKVTNTVGVVGMFAWLGQLFLGKNRWLNGHLKGTLVG